MRTFLFYISGHGFGHATRQIAVMESLYKQAPDSRIIVRTQAPKYVFDYYCRCPYEYFEVAIDTGVIEEGILGVNIPETYNRLAALEEVSDEIIATEVQFIRENSVDAVVFDLPPLAPEISSQSGIPSFGIGNFTWDFIYSGYEETHPQFSESIERIRANYHKTALMMRLPLSHSLNQFGRIERIPLIARKSTADREALRYELGLRPSQTAVLIALRGESVDGLMESADGNEVVLLSFGESRRSGVLSLGTKWQQRFTDVLVASDVVLSKPGYGVVSECIANHRPLLHLPRSDFRESEVLIQETKQYLPEEQLTLTEIKEGVLGERAIRLGRKAKHHDWQGVRVDGADVAADMILSY